MRRSLRAVIDAMCKRCLYDPGNGNGGWRKQVQGCSSSNCALHPVRPLPIKARKSVKDTLIGTSGPDGLEGSRESLLAAKIGLNDDTAAERRVA